MLSKAHPNFYVPVLSLSLLGISLAANIFSWQKLQNNQFAQTDIYYSLDQAADKAIINAIEDAQQYAYFAVYTFTKADIADALVAAKLRGLDVKGLTDFQQSTIDQEKPVLKKLRQYGIPVEAPQKVQGIMHIKLLVTDKAYASGSFNWTFSAANFNDEVLEVGKVQDLHDHYLQIFNEIYDKYSKYQIK